MNPELKKKIKNTLEQYEKKIDSMQLEIDQLNEILKQATKNATHSEEKINNEVNERLYQLLNHLAVPEDLELKKEKVKERLEIELNVKSLCEVIDTLTDLVIDSFNVEQKRFKQFLHKLTDQLHGFDTYLQTSYESQKEAIIDRTELEFGIEDHIQQIKTHIDTSKTIDELSAKVSKNFEVIGMRLKEYRLKEQQREKEYELVVQSLQNQIISAERSVEDVKNLLSFQKYRINHDSLTGLPNRVSYDEHIVEAFLRWKRHSNVFSLAIADIDFFKKINDSFGHLAGDKVLKKVALIFKSSIREVDFIARIGGEEFIFIFESTTSEAATVILEKLRQLVEECQFYYRENKVNVTASFGLTEVKADDNIESLFIRADKALYKAKHAGRNCVEVL